MYALYDIKAEVYDTPLFFLNDVTAKRWFYTMVKKGEGRFEHFKDDMELHKIVEFNVTNGHLFNEKGDRIKYSEHVRIITNGKQIGKENNNEISNEAQVQ